MCKSCETRHKTEGEKITLEKVKLNKPTLPICIKLENATVEIFKAISLIADKYELPYFLLESPVNNAAQRVSQLADKERKKALDDYKKQLEEGGGSDGRA